MNLQRREMSKVIQKKCESCGVPFKADLARFCSRECRSGWDKGGKTYIEKKHNDISRINQNWLKRKPRKKVYTDPMHLYLKNY